MSAVSRQDALMALGGAAILMGGVILVSWLFNDDKDTGHIEQYGGSSPELRRRSASEGTGDESFDAAARQARTLRGIPDRQRLELYALYKQATEGRCRRPRPGPLDFEGSAKWTAWNALADMSQETAREQYVAFVHRLSPAKGEEGEGRRMEGVGSERSGGEGGGDGGGGGFRSISRPVRVEQEEDEEEEEEDVEPLLRVIENHDVLGMKAAVRRGADINARNAVGESLLHYAADRGNLAIVKLLLEAGADVNAVEPEANQTPLMFACVCGNVDIAEALIRAGADAGRTDSDDCDALSLIESEKDKQFLERVIAEVKGEV